MTDLPNQTPEQQINPLEPIHSVPTQPTEIVQTEQTAPTTTLKHKSFWDFQLNLLKAIFTNWDFKRRISVSEYQYVLITLLILQFWVFFLGQDIGSLFGIFSLVVSVKLRIGRMKDMNWNPWLLLILIIPFVNIVFLLILLFAWGTKWSNNYGADVNNDYKKLGGVKRYYGLIQALIFFVLLALVAIPMIAMIAMFSSLLGNFPTSELMNQLQNLTWNMNFVLSWTDVIMSGGMDFGTGF